jgi:predicted dinucleotide-binding enzyme
MKIGIIGSGNSGSAMGRAWTAKGHAVLFSLAKDLETWHEPYQRFVGY